ncbi:FRG domain-containing protein [Planomicrobium chinense]|uniref:FRG domain-containing protein n=1 Tax=Planococcus chinensis TaxID=272917 RepID=UPI001CC815F5|nr:FRG domain-containing protein [Planococcus chinensis]MBZ5201565.1 FRG domain-containing protein [Planococcus chinensis]
MEKQDDGSYKAENWLDLQKKLFSFKEDEKHGRFRSSLAYRGVDNANFDLETSLMRIQNQSMESHLLRNFKKYAKPLLKDSQNIWELLSVAQHYGLPTRLLDWSFSPYVALHFATSDIGWFQEDGAIWCLDIIKVHELLPKDYKDKLKREESYVFTVDMLNDIKHAKGLSRGVEVEESLSEFDNSKDEDDFLICLEPPSIDERIINQYAMFTIMSNSDRSLSNLLKDYPSMYTKIIIPSELKLEIRDKLDQANINERMIYPGLQGISAWLKRYYTNTKLLKS